MALTPEQLAERSQGLGGSDAPVCAGVSPWKSPLQLYFEKIGALQPEQLETEAIEWGNRLEAIVADAYSEKTGRQIRRQPRKAHAEHPWMLGNIDRQIVGDKRGVGILEVKTTNTFSMKDWDSGPPDAAVLQLQHYLAIYGYKWGSIAALIGGQHFKTFDIERDDELIGYLVEIECRFWKMVQKREPPGADWTPENIGILKKLYPISSGKIIQLSERQIINADGFLKAKAEIEAAEERKALYEGLLKEEIQDADKATLPGYEILWRSTKPSKRFDEEKFKQENPEMHAQYIKLQAGYRRFQVRPSKEIAK